MSEQRLAVLDSNSFRLVVCSWEDGRSWKRTDKIHEAVRIVNNLD